MTADETVVAVLEALDRAALPWMIVGSLASNFHGIPLSDDPHDRERFERRQRVPMLGRHVFVATAEDMIVTKLRWAQTAGRSKDRDDVRNIVALRRAELDWAYIDHWTAAHGTTELLQALQPEADRGR